MNRKSFFVAVLLSLTLLCGCASYYYLFHQQKNSRTLAKELNYRILTKSLLKYKKIWNEAPADFSCGEWKKLVDVDLNFFRNNPDYFECFLAKGRVLVRFNGKKYYVYAVKKQNGLHYRIVTKATSENSLTPSYGVEVELRVAGRKKDSLRVIFEDTFHETYLPQRKYGIGPFVTSGDLNWDNFGQSILIDKYQVTYRDIVEWKYNSTDRKQTNSIDIPKSKKQWAKPAIGLSTLQMNQYCQFRGKELLQSHIYDAATFHPVDLDNDRPLKVVRGPYSWTFRRKNIFEHIDQFNLKLCTRFFVADCRGNAPYELYDTHSSSWIGMYQIQGGNMEAVRNVLDKKNNLILSSFYFDYKSPWHELGLRGKWNGEGIGYNSFDWSIGKKSYPPLGEFPNFKVGFRCMRYLDVP
ncbi:MAG: hypothetical protein KAG61_05925 [Bacteriovoracaceae bacterium]|nr:hypothetical protein [Bacteriovoracaceae bacterium]